MPPNSARAPDFWIFGGPNGSGKSTAYRHIGVDGVGAAFWIVNPDLLTIRIQQAEGMDLGAANLAAVQRLETWLEATLRVHQSLGVETVLSTPKYRGVVELAQSLGFRVRLFYVMLDTPERNVARVKERVEKGGHDVPPEKIVERYWRSLAQLPWFLAQSHVADIYDNSGPSPRRVGGKSDGVIDLAPDAPANLVRALAPLPE